MAYFIVNITVVIIIVHWASTSWLQRTYSKASTIPALTERGWQPLEMKSIRTYFQPVCELGNPQGAVIRTDVLNCEVWAVGDASQGEVTNLPLSPSTEVASHLFSDWWGSFVVRNLPANTEETGDWGSVPGSGRSPGIGDSSPLEYCCLENPLDRGAWWATVRGVAKNRRQLGAHIHTLIFSGPLLLPTS